MSIRSYLIEQYRKHPSMQNEDVIKLCYQAARGAEHLLRDTERAREYLIREIEAVEAADGALCEAISPEICRVNLAAWKHRGLPIDALFEAFVATASVRHDGEDLLIPYLDEATALIEEGTIPLDTDAWNSTRAEYEKMSMPAVHHSEAYRQGEHPAYRIVNRQYAQQWK